jgi:hypothetical protein
MRPLALVNAALLVLVALPIVRATGRERTLGRLRGLNVVSTLGLIGAIVLVIYSIGRFIRPPIGMALLAAVIGAFTWKRPIVGAVGGFLVSIGVMTLLRALV